jgi:flagellin
MRAEVAGLHQGIRNANDAVSMIQTADGALSIINEKLIRMKELAEQASTGTYNTEQRLMIDQEFQAMAAEINRIAAATDFNGVKLLDGSLSGLHNGSGLDSTGATKIHFGTGNDSAEDYYYITIGDASIKGLGLTIGSDGTNGVNPLPEIRWHREGNKVYAIIPAGTINLKIDVLNKVRNPLLNSMELFTTTGQHLIGDTIGNGTAWEAGGINSVYDIQNMLTEANGFAQGAIYNSNNLNSTGNNVPSYQQYPPYNTFTVLNMVVHYTGVAQSNPNPNVPAEYLWIEEVKEDLILMVPGQGDYVTRFASDYMPARGLGAMTISIETQEDAQLVLPRIDRAVIRKDQIRAHLGALQNRLENTASNLQIQLENTQAAESRISDADVAAEMSAFTRAQILTQAAVAMLSHANILPDIVMKLLEDV